MAERPSDEIRTTRQELVAAFEEWDRRWQTGALWPGVPGDAATCTIHEARADYLMWLVGEIRVYPNGRVTGEQA